MIGAEKSYGEKAILSAVAIFALPIYDNTQHAPDGSPIGRVLRVLLLKEDGREAEGGSLLAIRLGRGRGGDGWY